MGAFDANSAIDSLASRCQNSTCFYGRPHYPIQTEGELLLHVNKTVRLRLPHNIMAFLRVRARIGGALKRTADRQVKLGKDIPNAKVLYDVLQETTSIQLFYIRTEEIAKITSEMSALKLATVKGTMRLHQVISTRKGEVKYRDVSCVFGLPGTHDCLCFDLKVFQYQLPDGPIAFSNACNVAASAAPSSSAASAASSSAASAAPSSAAKAAPSSTASAAPSSAAKAAPSSAAKAAPSSTASAAPSSAAKAAPSSTASAAPSSAAKAAPSSAAKPARASMYIFYIQYVRNLLRNLVKK